MTGKKKPAEPKARPKTARAARKGASGDVPQFFRLSVEVGRASCRERVYGPV